MNPHSCGGHVVAKDQKCSVPWREQCPVRKELQDVTMSKKKIKRDLQCWPSSHPRHSALLQCWAQYTIRHRAFAWEVTVQLQNHLQMFLNLSPFPWEIIFRQLPDSMWDLPPVGSGARSPRRGRFLLQMDPSPWFCGWMIAHGHSGSCRHQAAWYDENYISDLYFLLVSAVVTLSDAPDPVAWLLV